MKTNKNYISKSKKIIVMINLALLNINSDLSKQYSLFINITIC